MKQLLCRLLAVLLCGVLLAGFALPAMAEETTAVQETSTQEEQSEQENIPETTEETTAAETTAVPAALAQEAAEEPVTQTVVLRSTEGNFMQGMVLTEGAGGDNALALAAALYEWEQETEGVAKHLSRYTAKQKALWYKLAQTEGYILQQAVKKYGFCDVPEEDFLFYSAAREFNRYKAGGAGDVTGDVDGSTWQALGLDIKETFEDAFKSWTGEWTGGGLSPIKAKLSGNTLTFEYSPVFYIAREYADGYTITDEQAKQAMDLCVEGFKGWEGTYDVYGQQLEVVVNVKPSISGIKLLADVKILPEDDFASMVPGAVLWKKNSPLLGMRIKTDDPVNDYWLEDTAMHEFGHVLGLFDAYGYGSHTEGVTILGIDISEWGDKFLPDAPYERASYACIMRSGWRVYPNEAEMLLWAWKNNKLQLYTESILLYLGAQVSQSFYH